jgi:hypothetical protein
MIQKLVDLSVNKLLLFSFLNDFSFVDQKKNEQNP